MEDAQFEWDDAKAALNWLKHRVTFEQARRVFQDTFAIERADAEHGDAEERSVTIRHGGRPASRRRLDPARRAHSHHLGT